MAGRGRKLCHHLLMTIEPPCVVSLSWTLTDGQNRSIDALAEPVEFLVGGTDLLAKVEEALAGHVPGERVQVHLEPEHAFGDYKAELVCFEARSLFPEHLEPGMTFEGLPAGSATPDMPSDAVYVVTEVYPKHVVLDGNHPLAGMSIRLNILVHAVREASAAELESGGLGALPLSFGAAAVGAEAGARAEFVDPDEDEDEDNEADNEASPTTPAQRGPGRPLH
jgi:FKBP-type peptidyl-prolyl cis-trans isomerase SlyD